MTDHPILVTTLDVEKNFLGALVQTTKISSNLSRRMDVSVFSPQYRPVASAVLAADKNHNICDALTVGDELERLGFGVAEKQTLLVIAESGPFGAVTDEYLEHLYNRICEKNAPHLTVDETVGVQFFITTEPPPLIMDIEGIRLSGDNGFTAGLPKAMKGLFSLEEARANATGSPFLRHFPTRKARVLYVSEEDREARLHRRVYAMMKGRPPEEIPMDDQLRFLIKRGVRLDTEKGLAVLRRHIELFKPDMVFLEHFDKMHTKNRDREEEAKPLLMELDKLTDTFGCTFRVQKHAKKTPAGQKPRTGELIAGSVALFGWGDSSVHLTLVKRGYAMVECEAKDGELASRFFVEYQAGSLVYAGAPTGGKKEQRQGELLDLISISPGLTTEDLAVRLGLTSRTIQRHLRPLQTAGLVVGHQENVMAPMTWTAKPPEGKVERV